MDTTSRSGVTPSASISRMTLRKKADQVRMMGEIYKGAGEVILWLGDDRLLPEPTSGRIGVCNEKRLSGGLTEEMGQMVREALAKLINNQHFHELASFTGYGICQDNEGAGLPPWHLLRDVLAKVFNATWFERAWTVQELVLARRATIIHGEQRIGWIIIARAFENFGRHMRSCCTKAIFSLPDHDVELLYRITENINALVEASELVIRGQHVVDPLIQFSWKGCKDSRDKLFGLIGLQTTNLPTPVFPDYRCSVQAVFTRFAADLVREPPFYYAAVPGSRT
jgi:hypothetical protein